jgi:hypothetical protein
LAGLPHETCPLASVIYTLPSTTDYGQSNTIILVNLPRGEHKVLIEAVAPEGRVLAAQTVTFKSPGK